MNYDKLVNQLREENKILRLESENVRQKLQDAQGDNQVRHFNLFVIGNTHNQSSILKALIWNRQLNSLK